MHQYQVQPTRRTGSNHRLGTPASRHSIRLRQGHSRLPCCIVGVYVPRAWRRPTVQALLMRAALPDMHGGSYAQRRLLCEYQHKLIQLGTTATKHARLFRSLTLLEWPCQPASTYKPQYRAAHLSFPPFIIPFQPDHQFTRHADALPAVSVTNRILHKRLIPESRAALPRADLKRCVFGRQSAQSAPLQEITAVPLKDCCQVSPAVPYGLTAP